MTTTTTTSTTSISSSNQKPWRTHREDGCNHQAALRNRINTQVDHWIEVEEARRSQESDVVWTERTLVVLAAAGLATTAAGLISWPVLGVVLGVCLIAYFIMHKIIHRNTEKLYETDRKELLAINNAWNGSNADPEEAYRLLEAYMVNRGLEFQSLLNSSEDGTPEGLALRLPRHMHSRNLLKDIVLGPKKNDPVISQKAYAAQCAGSGQEWGPYALVNRLRKTEPLRLLENKNLLNLYCEGLVESAVDAEDIRIIYNDLKQLREDVAKKGVSGPLIGLLQIQVEEAYNNAMAQKTAQ
jgi:hypothetical protein